LELNRSFNIKGKTKPIPNKKAIAAEMIPESFVSKPMKAVIDNPTKPEMISEYFSINLCIGTGGYRYRNGINKRVPIKTIVSGVVLIGPPKEC
jgi:hypothetical protein